MEQTLSIILKFSLSTILKNYGVRITVKFNHEKANKEVYINYYLDHIGKRINK